MPYREATEESCKRVSGKSPNLLTNHPSKPQQELGSTARVGCAGPQNSPAPAKVRRHARRLHVNLRDRRDAELARRALSWPSEQRAPDSGHVGVDNGREASCLRCGKAAADVVHRDDAAIVSVDA